MVTPIHNDPPTRTSSPNQPRPGKFLIRAVGGPHAGDHYELHDQRVVQGGRGLQCNDIVLPRDELVSRIHFSLEVQPAGFVLRDLDSRNGVFVGGARVPRALLEPGSVFRAGDSELQLTAVDAAPQSDSDHFGDLYGWSPVMRALFARLERLAAAPGSTLPLLITGATGTGKELVARGIHDRSARAGGPFVVLDCTALPPHLADAIVFGYSRGAFSGAHSSHPGVFEEADGGTLLIDELGELPLDLQSKLLRVLDRREVSRFDDPARVRKFDVRIISATNRDLEQMVTDRQFRQDLFYRVLGKHIALPTLGERDDDAVRLAERFVAAHCERLEAPPKSLTAAARQAIREASWPGNVRELAFVVQRAVESTDAEAIDVDALGLRPPADVPPADLAAPLRLKWRPAQTAFQAAYLRNLMKRTGTGHGWINDAADQAGMDRTGLVKALKRLGLHRNQDDDADE